MKSKGFSLVEIALSLGIFAFCLLAVMGLFTMGLKTERGSQEEDAASSTLAELGIAVENSTPNTDGTLSTVAPLDGWKWNPTSGSTTSGILGEYAYWVRVRQVNTTGHSRLMNARLEVAWPPEAATWSSEGQASGVRGSAGSSIFFFAR
jgi:type II secretory pathway pseudopilin PulG